MVIEREQFQQAPQVSDERIAGVVMRVLEKVNEESKERSHLEGINKELGGLRKLLCDPVTGKCIIATQADFEAWKAELRKKEQERQEKEKLPKMTAEIRRGMQNSEILDRDRQFARLVEGNHGTMVDSFRHVLSDPQSISGLKTAVLKMLKPEEVQDYLTECVIGPNGELICEGLSSKGFRVQRKNDKGWETLGVEKKEKETAKHFW